MSALSAAREALRAALAGLPPYVQVYEGQPRTLSTPGVVIRPGAPWIDPDGEVSLDVDCAVRTTGGRWPGLVGQERLVTEVLAALRADGWSPGPVGEAREESGIFKVTLTVTHRSTDC